MQKRVAIVARGAGTRHRETTTLVASMTPSLDDRTRWGWLAGLVVKGAPITTKAMTSPMPFCHFTNALDNAMYAEKTRLRNVPRADTTP
jgi:hypothetical protein